MSQATIFDQIIAQINIIDANNNGIQAANNRTTAALHVIQNSTPAGGLTAQQAQAVLTQVTFEANAGVNILAQVTATALLAEQIAGITPPSTQAPSAQAQKK